MLNIRTLNQQFEWVNPACFWYDKLDTLLHIKKIIDINKENAMVIMTRKAMVACDDNLLKHVMEDDVTKRDTIDSLGRKQQTSLINESGFYSLVFSSKLPKAREFKHWVTLEVLPQIRKTYCPMSRSRQHGEHLSSVFAACISFYILRKS